eukprot:CAMPEP_0198210730 /NCGR_PEP_ID=MMETSP1445-20131203/22095_1 /TAXON_ID=36898 /ORGANISM="Pyramimonas sp., Strain CCMP2087" /LENGTH=265 /DNA_ID=CAMNT_0043884871 /DNA_START=114 /DNA_END=911 /DNA_ORIENTATION=+
MMASMPSRPGVATRRSPALPRASGSRGVAISQGRVVMRVQSSDAGSKSEKVRALKIADPFAALGAVAGLGWAFDASASEQVFGEIALGLDTGVQLLYLGALLTLLAGGSFLVVRQVLVRRELENTAKDMGEKVRSGRAVSEEYFELGVVMLRKKSFTQAISNLEMALSSWDGEPEEKAQAYNALGYAYFQQEKYEKAVVEYKQAVELQPGYVTAWNNLGNAYEKVKQPEQALEAYQETLTYAPDNEIAKQRADMLTRRLTRLQRM